MPRILVVDDQADVRAMIAMVLRIHHFEVIEAASAVAGLKAFAEATFDLAIVDIFLSGSNGYELIVAMRERAPSLPVVAISGMTALEFVAENPELGTVVGLQKPFRPNELTAAIQKALATSPVG
jgi:DNA-binding response OmpR family regulator